jgi:hypothetical protein
MLVIAKFLSFGQQLRKLCASCRVDIIGFPDPMFREDAPPCLCPKVRVQVSQCQHEVERSQ